jgi:hypothetical protein
MMLDVVCIRSVFRISGHVPGRWPEWRARTSVMRTMMRRSHAGTGAAGRRRRVAGATPRGSRQHANGTSLARTASRRHDMSVSSKTGIDTRTSWPRDKMLSNEIMFDIRRVVPEHVRPTREQQLDCDRVRRERDALRLSSIAARVSSRAFVPARSGDTADCSNIARHTRRRLSSLSMRGTLQ